jgi:hypothetical protein
METEEIGRLLKASLDTQREHLAEYRRVTERSLDLQQRAVARQEQMVQVYRWLLVIGGGLVSILLMLLVYLLVRYSRPLFGI